MTSVCRMCEELQADKERMVADAERYSDEMVSQVRDLTADRDQWKARAKTIEAELEQTKTRHQAIYDAVCADRAALKADDWQLGRLLEWMTESPRRNPSQAFTTGRLREAADRVAMLLPPNDEAEQVTKGWLIEFGFSPRGESELMFPPWDRIRRDVCPWVLIFNDDSRPSFIPRWQLSFPGCQSGLGYDLPTRGDVRGLIKALGMLEKKQLTPDEELPS